jgi:glycosyltransferase involved in cell wall biosynthesis
MENQKISVIMPAFNEQETIIEILETVALEKQSGFIDEVIVINDGSTDNTLTLLSEREDLYDQIISSETNHGKGHAVKLGLRAAKYRYVLFQDADMEYDPTDYVDLVQAVRECNADIVIGSRLSGGKLVRVNYFWNRIGNRAITFLFNLLNNKTFTDIYSCYLLLDTSLLNIDALKANSWNQQAEILGMAIKNSERAFEVPIKYYGRTYDEGKKIRPIDIFPVFLTIIRQRFF